MDISGSFLELRPSLRTAVVLSLDLRLKCCVDTLPAARRVSLAAGGVRIRQLASATGQAWPDWLVELQLERPGGVRVAG
jgi:hypothetical protein